jgi:hypothetical protein
VGHSRALPKLTHYLFSRDEELLRAHDAMRPDDPIVPMSGGLDHDGLLALATELAVVPPAPGHTATLAHLSVYCANLL